MQNITSEQPPTFSLAQCFSKYFSLLPLKGDILFNLNLKIIKL